MKIAESFTSPVDISGKEFTIAASPKAFKILSDGLYKDKILAVVRELSCNAWDSHISAGNTDTSFDVVLPTVENKTFSIRDYGTGLSKELVESVYTTYFSSTKTNSNETTGALGLGSKAPFSLLNEFTIESFYNGTRYTFLAFIGSNGCPQISLLEESATRQPNGLKIILDFENQFSLSLASDFLFAAKKIFSFFPIMPNNNADLTPLRTVFALSDTVSVFRPGAIGDAELYIKQGTVVYPVTKEQYKKVPQLCNGLSYLVDVPIGSVDITASREELSYVDVTHDTLSQVITNIRELVTTAIEREVLSNCTTGWQLANCVNTSPLRRIFTQFESRSTEYIACHPVLQQKVVINVKEIATKFNADVIDVVSINGTLKRSLTINMRDSFSLLNKSARIVINDTSKGYYTRLNSFAKTISGYRNSFIVVNFKSKRKTNAQIHDKIFELFGNPPDEKRLLLSSISIENTKSLSPKCSASISVLRFKKHGNKVYSYVSNLPLDSFNPGDYVYVPYNRGKIISPTGEIGCSAPDPNIITGKEVIGLGKISKRQLIKENKLPVNLYTFADEVYNQLLNDPARKDYVKCHPNRISLIEGVSLQIENAIISQTKAMMSDPVICNAIELNTLRTCPHVIQYEAQLNHYLPLFTPAQIRTLEQRQCNSQLDNASEVMKSLFPMLQYVRIYSYNESIDAVIKTIVEYMQMVLSK